MSSNLFPLFPLPEVLGLIAKKSSASEPDQLLKKIHPHSFLRFVEWRKAEFQKPVVEVSPEKHSFFERLLARPKQEVPQQEPRSVCFCTGATSWASGIHCISFHVCAEHAAEFGVPSGPYWEDEVVQLQKMAAVN